MSGLLIRHLPGEGVMFSAGDPPNGILTVGFYVESADPFTARARASIMVDPSWTPEGETQIPKLAVLGKTVVAIHDKRAADGRPVNELGTPEDCIPIEPDAALAACEDPESRAGLWLMVCQAVISTTQQAVGTYTSWPVAAAYSLMSDLEGAIDEYLEEKRG